MRVNIGFPVVRTDGRAYGHVITKFSRMGRLPHLLSYGAPSTRALCAGGAPLLSNIPFPKTLYVCNNIILLRIGALYGIYAIFFLL